ncbi:hypothetical protein Acry_2226 [Acidiphilium cryptum JF-5]|uniref:Peptidase M20 n=1 Tax=Acidiphilium cryptum (strain JF-5) TaxID=349163 RepID=A5G0P0_ACICJ|nr:hypothetical protein Acry_2226 [Acidiphilium cryptum JF-5]
MVKICLDNKFLHRINGLRYARQPSCIIPASMGGSLPDYVFTKILGVDAFVVPYANFDEANHAPNENLRIDCFLAGIRTGAALLNQVGCAAAGV